MKGLIYLIDDNPIDNLIASSLLKKLDPSLKIREFTSAEKLLLQLETELNNLPQAILVDRFMPVMDGLSLVYHLKKDQRFQHIPCILTSATIDDPSFHHVLTEQNVLSIIEKPLTMQKLQHIILTTKIAS
jgi:response regulator RpfG family c-di-GMP phosphodiesterase